MGLLDSPFVGQLVVKGTKTITRATNGYILDSLDISRYNFASFKITVTSGSLDGTNSYVDFRGSVTNKSYSAFSVYPINTVTNSIGASTVKCSNGLYCSENISAFNFAGFYLVTTSEVTLTVDYYLSISDFTNTLILKEVSDSKALLESINNKRDKVIFTLTYNAYTASSRTIRDIGTLLRGSAKKYLKINVSFTSLDSIVFIYFRKFFGDDEVNTNRGENVSVIDENGNYVNVIRATALSQNFYMENVSNNFWWRTESGSVSDLKCTITISGTDYMPPINHIQPLVSATIDPSSEEHSAELTLNNSLFKNIKFWFCVVDTPGQKGHYITGDISKNWMTNEDSDSLEIGSFSSVRCFATKWYPVNCLGGSLTITLTSTVNVDIPVTIYGVV